MGRESSHHRRSSEDPAPVAQPSGPGNSPHDCFADEIAIDFPSVRLAIERMRDGFFGHTAEHRDDAEVLSTELRLSRQEAWQGLVVALEVPIRATCPACGGRGETWTEPCSPCGGTGESLIRHGVRVSVPAGVSDGARFRFRVTSPHVAPVRVEVRVAIRPAA